jgi:hypothetical protein
MLSVVQVENSQRHMQPLHGRTEWPLITMAAISVYGTADIRPYVEAEINQSLCSCGISICKSARPPYA